MLKPVTASAKSVTGLRDGNDNYIGFFFFFFFLRKKTYLCIGDIIVKLTSSHRSKIRDKKTP